MFVVFIWKFRNVCFYVFFLFVINVEFDKVWFWEVMVVVRFFFDMYENGFFCCFVVMVCFLLDDVVGEKNLFLVFFFVFKVFLNKCKGV